MAELTTGSATGSQGVTQNPQTVPSAQAVGGASRASGGVQPGTSKDVLTSHDGLSLSPSALTTVPLSTISTTQSPARPAPAPKVPEHHVNPALFVLSIALVLIAAGVFLGINRSAKTTTN